MFTAFTTGLMIASIAGAIGLAAVIILIGGLEKIAESSERVRNFFENMYK